MKLCLEALISSEVCVYICMILHRVSISALQFTASRDWKTVQNVGTGTSLLKPDQLDS